MPEKRTREGRGKADGKVSRMPPALKWPQRRATIGRAALCVRAALGVWLGGGRAAAPAASLGGLVRAFARPPAFLALARCALCSLAVCAFAQGAPARRACVLPPVAAVVRGLRVGRARAVAFCPAFFCAGGFGAAAWLSRPVSARPAPSPSVSPPCRRPLAWFAPCCGVGRGGAASAPAGRLSVVGLGGLAAGRALFCVPSAGCRPASRPVSRPRRASGRCRWRLFRRLVWRRLSWRVLAAAPAVFFSPLTTPLFSPWRWRAAMRSISVRGAKNSCAPVRPLAGRLSCGRGPRLGCVRGRRAWAVCLPASGRARSACRAVCALPRLRAAVAPVVWLAGFGDEGCFVLQRPRMGDGHAPSGAQIAAVGGDSAQTARKSQGGEVSPASVHKILCTKNPRPEKYWQGTAGNGSRPQNRGE